MNLRENKIRVVIFAITLIVLIFLLFNLSSFAEINFLFVKVAQVPMLAVVIVSFGLGCLFTFLLFFKGNPKSKKEKKTEEKKTAEPEKKDSEKK